MPQNPQYPGVYVRETSAAAPVIAGAPTSVTAFIGLASIGAMNKASSVNSFAAYQREFGPLNDRFEMSYAVSQFFVNGGSRAVIVRVPESEGAGVETDVATMAPDARTIRDALAALDAVADVSVMVLPGIEDPSTLAAACRYCESRRTFLLIDAPRGADTAKKMLDIIARQMLPISENAAVFFPWVDVGDSAASMAARRCGPTGSVAGLFARTDVQRGVWKAAAGLEASIKGGRSLACKPSDNEISQLNAIGVNCLCTVPRAGIVCWGARTLRAGTSPVSPFAYIPVRRTELFIVSSFMQSVQWIATEPNEEATWARLRASATDFLFGLFRQGAFQGSTPDEAYFVRCDATTVTNADVVAGRVRWQVGFAPLRPAEFVVLDLTYQLPG